MSCQVINHKQTLITILANKLSPNGEKTTKEVSSLKYASFRLQGTSWPEVEVTQGHLHNKKQTPILV